MRRTVVLLHTHPENPDHYDWLIDQPDLAIEHRLITFRTPRRPDQADAFIAEKAPDHRAIYLDYEGPISGGRGEVARVASGLVEQWQQHEDSITCRVRWGNQTHTLHATPEAHAWRFQRITP